MPTLSTHVSEEFADAVETAAGASPEKRVGPWLAKAAEARLVSEGMMPGDPKAEVLALAEELGLPAALETLRGKLRRASSSKSAA